MKNRNAILLTLLLVAAMALAACTTDTPPTAPPAPTATAVPEPTVATPTAESPATEVPEPQPEQPVGGIDVAWENVIQPEGDAVGIVNGVSISTEAYLEELRRQLDSVTSSYGLNWYDEETMSLLPTFQDGILQQLINEELSTQLAAAEGIVIDGATLEEEMAGIQADILGSGQYESWEAFLESYGATQEEIEADIEGYLMYQKLVEAHGGAGEAEQVHALHILVESEETGQEVLDKLEAGEAFADLAQEYSTDPGSAVQGGDLGWFSRGMMVPEFEEVAFSLGIDEISGLVQSQFGYHIIQVLEKETRPLEGALLEQVQLENFQVWFGEEMLAAEIEILVEFAAPTS